jgi:uncharacterized membrane-anchored protein
MMSARLLGFVALAVAQLGAAASGIARYERVLRSGTAVKLAVTPVDPADPFRGRYVTLAFAATREPVSADRTVTMEGPLFALLKLDERGHATIERVVGVAPARGLYIELDQAGHLDADRRLHVQLPFQRYYMQEHLAPDAERAYTEAARGPSSYAVVRVLDGRGVIEGVYLDGMPIEEAARKHASGR